jgi:hypothetical protein
MAGVSPMKDAVAAYLALRRTAGFAMANAEETVQNLGVLRISWRG